MIQFFILALSGGGFLLISLGGQRCRMAGFCLTLAGQPFWFYETALNGQWGMFVLTCVYTVSCLIGIVKNGPKKEKLRPILDPPSDILPSPERQEQIKKAIKKVLDDDRRLFVRTDENGKELPGYFAIED
jgi:hypothetical protein